MKYAHARLWANGGQSQRLPSFASTLRHHAPVLVAFDLERKLLVPPYLFALRSCSVAPTVVEEVLADDAVARALVA